MKLKDVNGTAINTDKLTLTLVLGSDRYMFTYLKLEDLKADYNAIYSKVKSK